MPTDLNGNNLCPWDHDIPCDYEGSDDCDDCPIKEELK